jgi:hypothetical protein
LLKEAGRHGIPYNLGRSAVRHRRLVALVWLPVAVVTYGAARSLGGETVENFTTPGAESQDAINTLDDPASAATVDDVRSQPHVESVPPLRLSLDGRFRTADVQ